MDSCQAALLTGHQLTSDIRRLSTLRSRLTVALSNMDVLKQASNSRLAPLALALERSLQPRCDICRSEVLAATPPPPQDSALRFARPRTNHLRCTAATFALHSPGAQEVRFDWVIGCGLKKSPGPCSMSMGDFVKTHVVCGSAVGRACYGSSEPSVREVHHFCKSLRHRCEPGSLEQGHIALMGLGRSQAHNLVSKPGSC